MDSFFGIGAPELVFILLLAGLVMGPKRIQQVAFWFGKVTAQLQAVSRTFVRQLNAELSTVDDNGDMKDALKEMQDLRRQLAELKSEVTSFATTPMAEGQKAAKEAKDAFNYTIGGSLPKQPKTNQTAETETPNTPPAAVDLPKPIEVSDDLE